MKMRVTFLGTGTSQGVPLINCDCPVCMSDNPKNKRLRCSIMVETGGKHILIDTSMDMRQQFLQYPFPKVDAVLFTHAHADHIFGLDELRRFNYLQKRIIPIYGNRETIERLKEIFNYAFNGEDIKYGLPNVIENIVDGNFSIGKIQIRPIKLLHGSETVLGFRFENFAYCTDVNQIPEESYPLLEGLDVLVIAALRETRHPKHFSVEEAIAESRKIRAKKTYFTHISHILDHEKHGSALPDGCAFAYDGLVLEL